MAGERVERRVQVRDQLHHLRADALTYILLNGAFGVGKSSVARELCALLPSAVIADPEWIGVLLQRIGGRHRSDFQNDPLWRRLAVRWARLRRHFGDTVIVPMTFSDAGYLEEIRMRLTDDGSAVLHFCLTAPLEVVRGRLAGRGEPVSDDRWRWVHRRAAECCAAHGDATFAEQVPTQDRSVGEVARSVASRLRDVSSIKATTES